MSEEIKPETKKSEALDEATLDQVSGGSHVKEEFRVAPHKDVLKR
jgi:propanediol dehydratase small subunit